VASAATLDKPVIDSGLLPRTLTIPPPDLTRRRMLFEAATARVPSDDIDFELPLAERRASPARTSPPQWYTPPPFRCAEGGN